MSDTVVIGAGFAGIATAWGLARRGFADVTVLERDSAPGQRASGRNAGMIRTLIPDEPTQRLAVASADSIARLEGAMGPVLDANGGLVLADEDDAAALRTAARRSADQGRPVEEIAEPPSETRAWLESVRFDAAFLTPADGAVDVHALLNAYLAGALAAGIRLETGISATRVAVEDGRVRGVETDRGFLPAERIVNAAGAWAARIPGAGSAPRLGLESRRRHLHSTGPVPGVSPDLPFMWHDTIGYYFRPESGGFLLSGCDETPIHPDRLEVDPAEEERLAAKLVTHVPALADLPVRRRWACQRTFSEDGRFVIGWDPAVRGLYWVAALGGHGVTVSAAVGELAAGEILDGPDRAAPTPFSPSRF